MICICCNLTMKKLVYYTICVLWFFYGCIQIFVHVLAIPCLTYASRICWYISFRFTQEVSTYLMWNIFDFWWYLVGEYSKYFLIWASPGLGRLNEILEVGLNESDIINITLQKTALLCYYSPWSFLLLVFCQVVWLRPSPIVCCKRSIYFHFTESGVFGVPLHVLLEQDQKNLKKSGLLVPLVFEQVCAYLLVSSLYY